MAGIVLWAFSVGGGFALARGKTEQAKTARAKADGQVFGRLAKAWAAELAGRHSQAIALAQPITKLPDPRYRWAALDAAHIQARAYHQSGTARGRARAERMWKKVRQLSKDRATLNRIEIAKALALEAASLPVGKPGAPGIDVSKITADIGALEPLLKAKRWNLATVEAALDLSRLYSQANRFDDARKTLDYVVAYLDKEKNIRVMELPPALAKPFIDAAKAARKNLKYDRNAGLAEFEAAQKLRSAKKFAEAMRAYQALVKNFPKSDYAPRGDLHVGDCLLGLRQTAQAIAHWEKFIAPAPAGPWRGQAYISIIDYYLQEQLDLPKAGKYAAMARSSLPAGLADKHAPARSMGGGMGVPPMSPTGVSPVSNSPRSANPSPPPSAAESWRLVAFDIHLRVGLVSFCQGQGKEAIAAEAFQAAKALTKNKATRSAGSGQAAESLDALIAAAKTGKPVIPADCRGAPSNQSAIRNPQSAISLALSMGTINLLIRRTDQADAFFDRVLGTPAMPARRGTPARRARPPLPGSTKAQRAFATFCRGATLQARHKPDQAKEYFQASIQAHKQGTWHDETLYRLATIIQDNADAKYGSVAATPKSAPKKEIRNLPAGRQVRNRERLAAFVKAKGAALPYWYEIIQRYPQSPRCEQAFYNAGILLCELAEAADAAGQRSSQSEAAWKKAAFMLDKFTEQYPKSPLAGDAYVRLIDVALERLFDLDLARRVSASAAVWASLLADVDARPSDASRNLFESLPWRKREDQHKPKNLIFSRYGCYLRAGIIAYLSGNTAEAQKQFAAAKLVAPSQGFDVVQGTIPKGIERLASAASVRRRLTPHEALDDKHEKASLVLQLADLYDLAEQFDKSFKLCELILAGAIPATREQQSWACFRRGRSRFQMDWGHRDPLAAKRDYIAAVAASPRAPWAYRGLFLAGNIAFNTEQDIEGAVSLWQELIQKYPTCPEVHRCAYYVGVAYEVNNQFDKAQAAYESFLKTYPDSPFAALVQSQHLPQAKEKRKEMR